LILFVSLIEDKHRASYPMTGLSAKLWKGTMKLLLTSAGIKNASIHDALLELLGKPIADCHALCIPTAGYVHPMGSPGGAWRFVAGREPRTPMVELGWKSLGLLELTAARADTIARQIHDDF
jgi:hypothetical protein